MRCWNGTGRTARKNELSVGLRRCCCQIVRGQFPALRENLERAESLEEMRDIIEKAYRELALAEQKKREKRQEL